MATKINVRLILELLGKKVSQNNIAKTRHMSCHSVSAVAKISRERGITYETVQNMSDKEIYRLFFPDKYAVESMYLDPDYEYVHKELNKAGVTLKLLWKEYSDHCHSLEEMPMGYTRFCEGYSKFTVKNNVTNHLLHKPGVVVEVDWSGQKMYYHDIFTVKKIPLYMFVATLPYSQYSYVELCKDMTQNTWLRCHIHMYEFFGGVPIRTVCDNLKTGVIKHPKEGDIILNEAYEALGNHYVTAIMPTGVRKPKQKASVEGTVGDVETAIIAALRNNKFYSLAEAQKCVRTKLEEFNKAPFQKREYSRHEVFQEEKGYLHELPSIPYEIAEWIYERKINLNCHILFEKNFYSCPYQYVGEKADLKITDSTVEIYIKGERIATHQKFSEFTRNKYSTHPEDMPEQFQRMPWDSERITRWACSIGRCTGEVIARIFASVQIKEQGYNPSLSVLRLSKTYSEERLENACELALEKIKSPRYRHLKAILSTNQDRIYAENKNAGKKAAVTKGYVRGAAYYGGLEND